MTQQVTIDDQIRELEQKIQALKELTKDISGTQTAQTIRKRGKVKHKEGSPPRLDQEDEQEDDDKNGKRDKKENVEYYEPTVTFVVIRSVLVLILFFILHYFVQEYFFKPTFKPTSTFDPAQLTSKLCPPGVESCSYQLKENWQDLLQRRNT